MDLQEFSKALHQVLDEWPGAAPPSLNKLIEAVDGSDAPSLDAFLRSKKAPRARPARATQARTADERAAENWEAKLKEAMGPVERFNSVVEDFARAALDPATVLRVHNKVLNKSTSGLSRPKCYQALKAWNAARENQKHSVNVAAQTFG